MVEHLTKDFREEIYKLFDKFKNNKTFCFSKFADVEWAAMLNETLNNSECENTPNTDQSYRNELINAIRFQDQTIILVLVVIVVTEIGQIK